MDALVPDDTDSWRRGPAIFLVLLLSIFAASPSWAGPSAGASRIVIEAEAKCVSGTSETAKRANPAHPPGLLGVTPRVLTHQLYVRPASCGTAKSGDRPAGARFYSYRARAPPAS
jgi:hypothetical protein